jgi:hypothetical protein
MLPPVVVLLGLVMALEAFSLISSMLMPSSRATTWATCKQQAQCWPKRIEKTYCGVTGQAF